MPADAEIIITPDARLFEFFVAMNGWETEHHHRQQQGENGIFETARKTLDEIYAAFLTKRKRSYGRQHPTKPTVSNLGWPPAFDPAQEVILQTESAAKKTVISTRWTHPTSPAFTEQRRYTLILRADLWRVDKQEVLKVFPTEKWQSRPL
jgi:hypothetical protein